MAGSLECQVDFQALPGTICMYGETKPYYETHVFVWKIENFMRTIEVKEGILLSPVFTGRRKDQWQLRVNTRRMESGPTQLRIHLYLLKMAPDAEHYTQENGIPTRFYISILDGTGTVIKSPVGGYTKTVFKLLAGWGYDDLLTLESLRASQRFRLADGNLVVRCVVQSEYEIMHRACGVEKVRFLKSSQSPADRLAHSFLDLLNNPTLSDLVIEVGSTQYPVHKIVLAARSPVFKAMLTEGQETTEPVQKISIDSFQDDVVKTMLEYIYAGQPTDKSVIISKPKEVLLIGNAYQLTEFLELCDQIIADNMSFENALHILAAADAANRQVLTEKAAFFINWSKLNIRPEEFKRAAREAPHIFKHLYLADGHSWAS